MACAGKWGFMGSWVFERAALRWWHMAVWMGFFMAWTDGRMDGRFDGSAGLVCGGVPRLWTLAACPFGFRA
jgi:hypothetical protein